MDPDEYKLMYEVEESHWWYHGMAEVTRSIIEKYYPTNGNIRILDAGCGTGAGMAFLSRYGNVYGFDISPLAIQYCMKRSHRNLAIGSVMEVPFSDTTFELITSLDVLYFTDVSDEAVLKEFVRVLLPGGRVIIRVPAFNWLRGIHDEKVSTGHRYTLRELKTKLSNAGFHPLLMSYANAMLLPFVVFKRFLERPFRFQTASDTAIQLGFIGKLFRYFLTTESRLITRHSLPLGVSIFGVAQKPKS
ncbi:MAG: class I SAM-dependent methyltransferase [Deltaproteobacteria bacterium]|nr:class I SAM-dependent methyltransferase [Deltaproteobacteria bacterium]